MFGARVSDAGLRAPHGTNFAKIRGTIWGAPKGVVGGYVGDI